MRYLILTLVLLLSACTSLPQSSTDITTLPALPILDDSYFGEQQPVILIDDVFKLNQAQQAEFLAYYHHHAYRNIQPNKRIAGYLKSKLKQFNFYSDTLTAEESLADNRGNCLSLAILTKALANIVNVGVAFELVKTPPIYQKEAGLLLTSQHIRTVLFESKSKEANAFNNLWSSSIRIDYFPSDGARTLRKVDENEFYSMYFQNKAAEALINNEAKLAFWFLKYSLTLNPIDPQTINLLAVIHERISQTDAAKKLYEYGIKYFGDDFELLNNYEILLRDLGQYQEAAIIAKRLEKFNELNPFKWVSLGDDEYNIKNYRKAISYYKKASKLADYLHEPYFGIARSYYFLGELGFAKRAMRKAIDKSNKTETRSIYQKKWQLLSHLIERQK